jgi:hypothetical protein
MVRAVAKSKQIRLQNCVIKKFLTLTRWKLLCFAGVFSGSLRGWPNRPAPLNVAGVLCTHPYTQFWGLGPAHGRLIAKIRRCDEILAGEMAAILVVVKGQGVGVANLFE